MTPAKRTRRPSYSTIKRLVAAALFVVVAAVVVSVVVRYWPSKQGDAQGQPSQTWGKSSAYPLGLVADWPEWDSIEVTATESSGAGPESGVTGVGYSSTEGESCVSGRRRNPRCATSPTQ